MVCPPGGARTKQQQALTFLLATPAQASTLNDEHWCIVAESLFLADIHDIPEFDSKFVFCELPPPPHRGCRGNRKELDKQQPPLPCRKRSLPSPALHSEQHQKKRCKFPGILQRQPDCSWVSSTLIVRGQKALAVVPPSTYFGFRTTTGRGFLSGSPGKSGRW